MAKKNTRNTKGRIVSAAWKLFYEQGYEDTTVEEIIEESGTSRGSFYHYFTGKDSLLSTLSLLFDEKYEKLMAEMPEDMPAFDKLLFMNAELFGMVEDSVSLDILARLLSSQVITKGERHLLDHRRLYYKVLRQVISEGREKGEITKIMSTGELVKLYAMTERALLYDWCISNGEFSLKDYSVKVMPFLLSQFKADL